MLRLGASLIGPKLFNFAHHRDNLSAKCHGLTSFDSEGNPLLASCDERKSEVDLGLFDETRDGGGINIVLPSEVTDATRA